MALRQEIESYSIGDVKASYQLDTGNRVGGENFVHLQLRDDQELTRHFYFEEGARDHCRNFVRKVANDEEYRRQCLEGSVTWAKIQRAYQNHSRVIRNVYSPLSNWEEADDEASDLYEKYCRELYERFSELFEEVKDPVPSTVESVVETVVEEAEEAADQLREKYAPYSVDHEISFGKHEGKTLLQIAQKHPGYAEWAIEELSNRPKVRKGFENALVKAEEEA